MLVKYSPIHSAPMKTNGQVFNSGSSGLGSCGVIPVSTSVEGLEEYVSWGRMVSKEVARRGVLDSRSVVHFCPASNTTLKTLALTQWQVENVLSQVVRDGYLMPSEQEWCATWSVLSPHGSPLLLRAYPRPHHLPSTIS